MNELKNTFLAGKMNKDVDSRMMPQGEYRDALNIKRSASTKSKRIHELRTHGKNV